MDDERGFTLLELLVAVAIVSIILGADGIWMLSMRPAALRAAVDTFDADLAAAHAIAASSGNGATLAFLPRSDGAPGYELRVYSGRPTAPDAVHQTSVARFVANATVAEATYGAPPFAIFFNSAGHPTGTAHYPHIDAGSGVTFPAIATQPPCANAIVLTFKSLQGASDTRTLPCDVAVSGTSVANPSPTPNPMAISPHQMVAHWTSDTNGALRFRVAEFGYSHWYAKGDTACDGITTFASPNPYATPSSPQELTLPPAPPSEPISYPNSAANPDQPRAPFELRPIAGAPGVCTIGIVDDYGQSAHAAVQVMGDLTASATTLTFDTPTAPPQTLTFSKTWDSEPLQLKPGGACGGVIAVPVSASLTTPQTPTDQPALASLTIAPQGKGGCTLLVTDQYGEPPVAITINVKAAQFKTWPAQITLGAGGSPISPATGCYAQATSDGITPEPLSALPSFAQTWAATNGIYTDATGCFTNASGTPVPATSNTVGGIIYEPDQVTRTFSVPAGGYDTCSSLETGWFPSKSGAAAMRLVQPALIAGTCTLALTDGVTTQKPAINTGLVTVNTVATQKYAQISCSATNQAAGGQEGCSISGQDGTVYFSYPNQLNPVPCLIDGLTTIPVWVTPGKISGYISYSANFTADNSDGYEIVIVTVGPCQ